MNGWMQDKLFAGCGIAFVVLVLAGSAIAMVGGDTHVLTVSTSTADIADAMSKPAGAATWIGAYLELIGFGAFLAFSMWACEALGGGVWAAVGRGAAIANTAVSVTSLALMNAISYRAGHGIDTGLVKTLVTVNQSIYVATWFLSAFFLIAVGVLALAAGRRKLGTSALAIAAFTFVATPLSVDDIGQFSALLFFVWCFAASIALVRGERRQAHVAVTA